jgi:alpha-beta hydrolase superfamily lysophospholipase
VSRLSVYRDDLDIFLDHVKQLDGVAAPAKNPRREDGKSAPLFVLAHSVGGLLALSYVLDGRAAIDCLAVSSPFLRPAFRLPLLAKSLGPIARYVMPTLAIPNPIEAGALTHDRAVVEAYKRDPLVLHTLTPAWWYAIRDGQKELEARAAEITLPVLFMLGAADRLADWRHSRAVFERLGSTRKRLKVYPGFFHEVLNELGREQVIADALSWFDESLRDRAGAS